MRRTSHIKTPKLQRTNEANHRVVFSQFPLAVLCKEPQGYSDWITERLIPMGSLYLAGLNRGW